MTLSQFFLEQTVEPISIALKENENFSTDFVNDLKSKMEKFRDDIIDEINRFQSSVEVKETVTYLIDKVDEMEDEAPFSIGDDPDLITDKLSINEMILLSTLCTSEDTKPLFSPLVAPSHFPSKRSSPCKRAKRSLEDTVQMLSKENSASPPPPQQPTMIPFVFPPNPETMHKWLASPFTNPLYLNAINIFQQPASNPSDEQLATLMKMSINAANFIKNAGHHVPAVFSQPSCPESEVEDTKIDVESDEGDVSPSPSICDLIENDSSSSSSGPIMSPTSGENDSSVEKPFICMHNNCGKRFANKFLLKKHMFIHTGLRPHTCPHCHKKFNRKDNLLRHKKTHSPVDNPLGPTFPKNPLQAFVPMPTLHNLALAQGFSHFHALKMSLENAGTPVRSLS